MTTPTLDIIIPVWNSPTETRGCLASILESTESARLIIINNGCDRATELMLEEFCDHLGERALYMTMERNIGFVPAANRALKRSEADWALIVQPTTSLNPQCIQQVLHTTSKEKAGIITPRCPADIKLPARLLKSSCPALETCDISFSAIAISKILRETIGYFDEGLDGGPWCLHDYRYRSDANDFRTYLVLTAAVEGKSARLLGSTERRRKLDEAAVTTCRERWGTRQHLAVYLPRETDDEKLNEALELLLAAARHGHIFEFFLHRKQYNSALKHGAACLHSGITLHKLSVMLPLRSLARGMSILMSSDPRLLAVCGLDGIPFPGYETALPQTKLGQLARL